MRLIAGSGRSGTTWVLDSIATANNLRPVFEPLNPFTSATAALYADKYLVATDEHVDLYDLFRRAYDGDLYTLWSHYRIPTSRLRPRREHWQSVDALKRWLRRLWQSGNQVAAYYRQRSIRDTLVKCVRANLMLEWIHAHFDTNIVFLIRHPGAVVESQLRTSISSWDPYRRLEAYRADSRLMDGPLAPYKRNLERNLDPVEALTTVWCVENLVPASRAHSIGFDVVFYEELLEKPECEWPKLVAGLGLETVPAGDALAVPSQQARWKANKVLEHGYSRSYYLWRERLDRDHCSRIQSVLSAFEIGFYHIDQTRPDVREFEKRFSVSTTSTADVRNRAQPKRSS